MLLLKFMHGLEGLVCLLQRVSFMHILSWNCQGLNNPPTRRALLNLEGRMGWILVSCVKLEQIA